MAKLTWKGEDELHQSTNSQGNVIEMPGPSFTIWQGIKFPKDEAVEVTDSAIIAKAKLNRYFKVEGAPGRPKKVETDVGHENAG